MIDESWQSITVTDFVGEWSLLEQSDVPKSGALLARNVDFWIPGMVGTRTGWIVMTTPNDAVTGAMNWVFADPVYGAKNYIVYFKTGYGVRQLDVSSNSASNLYSISAYSAAFAEAGIRFYAAHFDAFSLGVDGGKVFQYGLSGADTLFARPLTTSEVTVTCGAPSSGGSCSAGTHYVAYLPTTRMGFTSKPEPVGATSYQLTGTSVVTTAANKKFLVTVTPTATWPTWAGTIQLAMTTTTNYSRFLKVPGAILATPAGGSTPVTYTIDISDTDLSLQEEVTDYQNLVTQGPSGTAPFKPHCCFVAGDRMIYLFKSSTYGQGYFASKPGNYQAIQNPRYLPGQLEITCGWYQDRMICLTGPRGTYYAFDNGDDPSTWAAEGLIDGTIGTPCIRGVDTNVASGNTWVVDPNGLYRFFGGHFDARPASYYQTNEWRKINFAVLHTIQVKDWAQKQTVSVIAPLKLQGYCATSGTYIQWTAGTETALPNTGDTFCPNWKAGTVITINGVANTIVSVTSNGLAAIIGTDAGVQVNVLWVAVPDYPTHEMCWNYSEGTAPSKVKYSRNHIQNVAPGAICVVRNDLTKREHLWLFPNVAGSFYRRMETNEALPYRDGNVGIRDEYKTSWYPGISEGGANVLQHHGLKSRSYGKGTMVIQMQSIDGNRTVNLAPISLLESPGKVIFRGAHMLSESISYDFSNNGVVDTNWAVSLLMHYYSIQAMSR